MHPLKRAFIAFGSNVGDRLANIEEACRSLETGGTISIRRSSGLWQTKAMYVTDQNDFLNGVLEIETTLDPFELLDRLQTVENEMGRKRLVEKGPRTLDLDILLFDGQRLEHERLNVPHKLMLERHFVLEPLCELIPNERPQALNGSTPRSFAEHLQLLGPSSTAMSPMTPLSSRVAALEALIPSRRTVIMSILNATPDSFSDGSLHNISDVSSLEQTIASHFVAGATILDIGGQSTRPKAPSVEAEDEIARVIPAIRAARTILSNPSTPDQAAISIDTYRASVARAAVQAGASIVNDVSGGTLDPDILQTMADLGCTVILMHMRGTPETMSQKEHTAYDGDIIKIIADELLERVQAAEAAGIRRWRIILDPGIGFAKTAAQNLEVLRRFSDLRDAKGLRGLPWVIGASRKGFIGKITGVEQASERNWGTAATVAASIQGGADVVRVHDVDEMCKVAKMSDAIWRA